MQTLLPAPARHPNSTRRQPRRSKLLSLAALVVLSTARNGVLANDTTWINAGSANWGNAASWSNGVPEDNATTILRFGGTTSYTATNNIGTAAAVFNLNALHVTNAESTATVTIARGGTRVLVLDGTSSVNYNAASALNITAPIFFNGTSTLQGTGTGAVTLDLSGGRGNGNRTLNVNLPNAASVTINTLNISNDANPHSLTLSLTTNLTVGVIADGASSQGKSDQRKPGHAHDHRRWHVHRFDVNQQRHARVGQFQRASARRARRFSWAI
jgi:hypothetical protein